MGRYMPKILFGGLKRDPHCLQMQDSSKIIELEKECEDSTALIPKLEENIPKLQKFLLDEEKVLEEIKDNSKNIANLSGGEKTLSSLALVFALHHYKPIPLYVMDEIDSCADFKNVSIVGHYVKDRTKDTQFIIISLRNNMFELADRLVGIYKTDNCTKSITINSGSFMVCEKTAL
ncbi:structural maintenance of chromosomes protein 4-like [Corylus avellana]|uniref:structural maintenance of chromosomes protein 4-like n=1 Tax=Corylus avellana TaxID=13451 RepID=UPI00286A84ED|nr:structural maintenance of chromosomes protein 4-like [Corylus avellana]